MTKHTIKDADILLRREKLEQRKIVWEKDAACADHTFVQPDDFFPDSKGYDVTKDHIKKVKAVCNYCPVNLQCLTYALELEEMEPAAGRHGIYGGLTPSERRILLKDIEFLLDGLEDSPDADLVTA